MAKGLCELWLEILLTEIGYAHTSELDLFYYNKAAVTNAHYIVQHDRTKHMKINKCFIKEDLEANVNQFPFLKSEDRLTDIITKVVSSKDFCNSSDKLRIKDLDVST